MLNKLRHRWYKFFTVKEVFVNKDGARVGLYKSILDEAGIPNFVRNGLANNITEIPIPIFYPALCVMNDEDYPRAMELLGAIYHAPLQTGPDWTCVTCGESVPTNFDACWNCQTSRAKEQND